MASAIESEHSDLLPSDAAAAVSSRGRPGVSVPSRGIGGSKGTTTRGIPPNAKHHQLQEIFSAIASMKIVEAYEYVPQLPPPPKNGPYRARFAYEARRHQTGRVALQQANTVRSKKDRLRYATVSNGEKGAEPTRSEYETRHLQRFNEWLAKRLRMYAVQIDTLFIRPELKLAEAIGAREARLRVLRMLGYEEHHREGAVTWPVTWLTAPEFIAWLKLENKRLRKEIRGGSRAERVAKVEGGEQFRSALIKDVEAWSIADAAWAASQVSKRLESTSPQKVEASSGQRGGSAPRKKRDEAVREKFEARVRAMQSKDDEDA